MIVMDRVAAFETLGINKFRELGYTGSRVKIMSDELIQKEYRNVDKERWEKVICPKGYRSANGSWHGSAVMNILQDICPDATYIAFPMDMKGTAKNYESKCVNYILENKVHLFTTSQVSGICSPAKEKAMQDCIDNGTTFFCAAGNKGDDGMLGEAKSDKHLAIGFIGEKLKYIGTSSIGEELDYVTIPNCYGDWTSYASPLFCAMCGLVQDYFIDKTGRALVRSELIEFINDHLIDVEDEGFDVKTGNGLFILPNPNEINISKYVPEYSGNIDYSGFPEIKGEEKMPIICLDYGHGASTEGKKSPDGTLLEYEFNRDVGRRLKAILERHNVEVIESAIGDADVSLSARCDVANFYKCDYFVSIHANAHKEEWTDASGWEIYIIAKGGQAEELAKRIHKYSKELGLKDRGIKVANFQVLRDTEMPAVLIEHGFYTNKEECEKLKSDSFRQKCAECDAKGILEQLGMAYVETKENVTTKKEVTDTNVGELVFTIGKKTYTANGVTKELEIAPEIENGRTKIPIAPLRDIGLTVEWDGAKQTVTVRR